MTTANLPSQSAAERQPAAPASPRRALRRTGIVAAILFVALLAFLGYIGVLGGNVRVVEPGRFYRSATLSGFNYTSVSARWLGNDMSSVLKRDHIGTVVTLRDGSLKDDWYKDEVSTCAAQNVAHADIPISARKLPPPDKLLKLLNVFDHARYPILIHCQAGSDRTGLASALYANIYEHIPLDRAESEELTWRYGHFPVDKTRQMDRFFDLYRKENDGLSLREWIVQRYPNIYQRETGGSS